MLAYKRYPIGTLIVAIGICALFSAAAAADPVPVGDEFVLSEADGSYVDAVDIESTADGGFVVVWNGRVPTTGKRGVFGRRFDALATPLSDDFRVDADREDTFIGASAPMVGVAEDDAFAVSWFWDDMEVLLRAYDAAGSPQGNESVVHSDTSGDHLYPDVVGTTSEFVCAWERNTGGNPTSDSFARRVEPSGEAVEPQVTMSDAIAGADHHPRLAARGDDGFVSVWQNRESGIASRILARIYADDDAALSDTIVVTEEISAGLSRPVVATTAGGSFVVAWQQRDGNDDLGTVLGRRYDSDGDPLADAFVVATEPAGVIGYPGLAAFDDGSFVVVWSQYNVAEPKIYGRGFDSAGAPMSDRFLVGGSGASRPAISSDRSAGFVVAWSGEQGRGRRFTLDPVCGDADADGEFLTRDALTILHGSVGLVGCELCLCATSGADIVTATDALRVLNKAVGLDVEMTCPLCP